MTEPLFIPSNASSIYSTESGIVKVKDLQRAKARLFIVFTLLGILTSFRLSQASNADLPIVVTVLGISTFLITELP